MAGNDARPVQQDLDTMGALQRRLDQLLGGRSEWIETTSAFVRSTCERQPSPSKVTACPRTLTGFEPGFPRGSGSSGYSPDSNP